MLNRGLDKQELLRIVDSVANEKSIDKELILTSMETAIQRAAYSKFGFENAIEAKTSKTEKKLKMIELQLKKMKLDQDKKTDDGTIEGEGYVIADRNDILKSFIDKENDK